LADFESELLSFPSGRYDDQVDAFMLFLDWFSQNEPVNKHQITGQRALLDQNPLLAPSINKNRFPYLDPLNHVRIELLKRHRAGDADAGVVQAIHATINGIAPDRATAASLVSSRGWLSLRPW
jgi:hypothetical protein